MGHGRALSPYQRGQIDAMHARKKSSRVIAAFIGKSKTCVNNYLARRGRVAATRQVGRPRKLSERNERAVVRMARAGRMTARKILEKTGVNASLRTVQRVLWKHEDMEFANLLKRPKLEPHHIAARLAWAKTHSFTSVESWKRTVFTDEKRFCLDGPDGNACFWADKRLPRDIFSKRPRGGGGVMIWAGISWRGKTPLVVVNGSVDAEAYVNMLEDVYNPWVRNTYPRGAIFQQDNASAHTARHTKEYFMMAEMHLLDWPAKSPDMNVIENAWGMLTMALYDGGRQFDTVEDLKEALSYEWEKIDIDYIRTLVSSMPRRVWELYNKKGGHTKY